jgi:hypothetical protein
MWSILKRLNVGIALMIISPIMALVFAGWEAFFPVAMISLFGRTVCSINQGLSTQLYVGQLTAELVQGLVSADQHDRELVLACLSQREREWFLAEIPRAEAALRRRYWKPRQGICASVNWRWRLRVANKVVA